MHQKPLSLLYTSADSLINKMVELNLIAVSYKPDVIAVVEILPKKKKHSTRSRNVNINKVDTSKPSQT